MLAQARLLPMVRAYLQQVCEKTGPPSGGTGAPRHAEERTESTRAGLLCRVGGY